MAIVVSALRGLRGARQRVSGVLAVTAQDWGFFFFSPRGGTASRLVPADISGVDLLLLYWILWLFGSLAHLGRLMDTYLRTRWHW